MMYLMDLTPEARNRIEKVDALEPDKLQLEDVQTTYDGPNFMPDWKRVKLIINRTDTQSKYNAIILYDNQRIVKVRKSPNRMISRIGDSFPLDYKNDLAREISRSMDIKRQVPFICGDYWLMPLGKLSADNRNWYRWDYSNDKWHLDWDRHICEVTYDRDMHIKWHVSPEVIRRRQTCCRLIAGYLKLQAIRTGPTLPDEALLFPERPLSEIKKRINNTRRADVLKKVGMLEFYAQTISDLDRFKFEQLPETEW